MGKVVFEGPIAGACGSVCGITIHHGNGFPQIRIRAGPRVRITRHGPQFNLTLHNLALTWQNQVTPAEKNDWNIFALTQPTIDCFGNAHFLNGYQQFVRTNLPIVLQGYAPLLTPPTSTTVNNPTVLTATLASPNGPYVLTDGIPPLATHEFTTLRASGPLSAGLTTPLRNPPLIFTGPEGSDQPYNFSTQYADRYGPSRPGMKISLKAQIHNSETGAHSTTSTALFTFT